MNEAPELYRISRYNRVHLSTFLDEVTVVYEKINEKHSIEFDMCQVIWQNLEQVLKELTHNFK